MRILIASALALLVGSLAGAQQPTPSPQTMEPPGVFRASDSDRAMDWGAAPPGTPHAPRPRSYDLQHQIVRLTFDWTRHAVVGSTTVRVAALDRPLTRVELDAVGMTINAVKDAAGASLRFDYDGRTLAVVLPGALAPGGVTTITVDYAAVRPKAGVYFVDRRRTVWTQGKLEDTRYWVPTYDAPDDKRTWEFFIRSARGERAWSVGTLAGERAVDGGVEWHWVQETPAAAYFMSVAVGPFATADDSAGATRLHYWARPDSIAAARKGFAATPRAIDLFTRKLGVPFPAPSFDQIAVPDFPFWNALEQWRPLVMTTVHDEQLVLDGEHGWPGEDADMVVARAVAQQWFGKLVTPSDWSHLWLADGAANFLAQVYLGDVHGQATAAHVRGWSHVGAFAADRDARRPLVYDRWQYGPVELLLTEHATHKGAVVLWMLRHELGDSAFWAGMHSFLTQHAGGNATTEDFRQAMEAASRRDLGVFFRQWVYGAGFPFLRVSFRYDSAAKQVVFTAVQYQQRDSLTGLFDASADVEILTDAGIVRAVVPLHGERSEHAVAVPAAPRSVRWDPEKWLLSEVTFEPPTSMLVYQLEHHPDAAARAEAAGSLGQRAMGMRGSGGMTMIAGDVTSGVAPAPPGAETEVMPNLLRAARSDSSVEVRSAAIDALQFGRLFNAGVTESLLELTHDHVAAIR